MEELRNNLIEELKPITHLIEGLEYISLGDILDYLIYGKRYRIPPATAGKSVDVGKLAQIILKYYPDTLSDIVVATAIKEAIEKGEV